MSLAAGPALAAGAAAAGALGAPSGPAGAAALVAGLGAGAVGLYDDVVGARPEQKAAKGFAGHLAALREGRVTGGLVKVVGVGAAGLGAAALLAADHRGRRAPAAGSAHGALGRSVDVLLGAGVIAGTANLLNLLDLRPGRALKSGLLLGAPADRRPARRDRRRRGRRRRRAAPRRPRRAGDARRQRGQRARRAARRRARRPYRPARAGRAARRARRRSPPPARRSASRR